MLLDYSVSESLEFTPKYKVGKDRAQCSPINRLVLFLLLMGVAGGLQFILTIPAAY
jgi:hypothetical protein